MESFLEPRGMDSLPNELYAEMTNYLSVVDLQGIRSVSYRWNETAKYSLRKRWGKRKFTLHTVSKLAQFNTSFVNYEPKEDFAVSTFCFTFPLLASEAASEHLDTFGHTFGTVVKNLVLNLSDPASSAVQGSTPEVKVLLNRHVAALLAKVKGQLEKLQLQCCRGLCSSGVIGSDPFPALRVLHIRNSVPGEAAEDEAMAEVDAEAMGEVDAEAIGEVHAEAMGEVHAEAMPEIENEVVGEVEDEAVAEVDAEAMGEVEAEEMLEVEDEAVAEVDQADGAEEVDPPAAILPQAIQAFDLVEFIRHSLTPTCACDEPLVLAISEKVPVIEIFQFDNYTLSDGDDPAFLSTVLRNLVRANSEVTLKLELKQRFRTVPAAFLTELLTVPVKITHMCLMIDTSDKTDELRKMLKWISAQSDCLKSLLFVDTGEGTHQELDRTDLKFPPMRALEELDYFPLAAISLIQYESAAHFPKLRTLRTVLHQNDFIAPLPTVTELVILNGAHSGDPLLQGYADAEQLFKFRAFPNLTQLTCSAFFCHVTSLYKLRNLTCLTLMPFGRTPDFFWNQVTRGVPKLTLDEILALPEPNAENSNEDGIDFRSLESLARLDVVMGVGQESVNSQLDALVYLSKTKRLQRLPQLDLDLVPISNAGVPKSYLEQLRKYHGSVTVYDVDL